VTAAVDVSLRVGPDRFRPLADLRPAEAARVIDASFYGRVAFRVDDSVATLADNVVNLIAAVCFDAVAAVARCEPWMRYLETYPGTLTAARINEEFTLCLDGEVVLRAPVAAVVPDLLEAGRAAIEAMVPLIEQAPYGQEQVEGLRGLAEECRAAIGP
jgi:hypothetical protein